MLQRGPEQGQQIDRPRERTAEREVYRIVTEPSGAMNANHSRHGAPALAIASDVTAVAHGSSRTLDELHDEHVI